MSSFAQKSTLHTRHCRPATAAWSKPSSPRGWNALLIGHLTESSSKKGMAASVFLRDDFPIARLKRAAMNEPHDLFPTRQSLLSRLKYLTQFSEVTM